METIFALLIFLLIILSLMSIIYVKIGKAKNLQSAFCLVLKEFYDYCNEPSTTQTSSILFPYPLDARKWIEFEKKIRNKFVDVDFVNFEIANGICFGEYAVVSTLGKEDLNFKRKMLENTLRNFLLSEFNLHNLTFFSIYISLSQHSLRFYYAINEEGVKCIERQRANEISRKTSKKK